MIREFPASLDHLHEMLNFVCGSGRHASFQDSHMYQIELAVEEAIVNIILYAFPQKQGMIEIERQPNEKFQFSVVLRDKGKPFNLLNSGKLFDISAKIEKQSMGGWGIFFILKIMDEIKYEYREGKNTLTLIKYKEAQSSKS